MIAYCFLHAPSKTPKGLRYFSIGLTVITNYELGKKAEACWPENNGRSWTVIYRYVEFADWDSALMPRATKKNSQFVVKNENENFQNFKLEEGFWAFSKADSTWILPSPDILISRQDDTYMTQIMSRNFN